MVADDTSLLYRVRWAWPLKNDTTQLYTYSDIDSNVESSDRIEGLGEVKGYDRPNESNDCWLGVG